MSKVLRVEKYHFIHVGSIPSNDVPVYMNSIKKTLTNNESDSTESYPVVNYYIPCREMSPDAGMKMRIVVYSDDGVSLIRMQ